MQFPRIQDGSAGMRVGKFAVRASIGVWLLSIAIAGLFLLFK